jgi:hypothetical protein
LSILWYVLPLRYLLNVPAPVEYSSTFYQPAVEKYKISGECTSVSDTEPIFRGYLLIYL